MTLMSAAVVGNGPSDRSARAVLNAFKDRGVSIVSGSDFMFEWHFVITYPDNDPTLLDEIRSYLLIMNDSHCVFSHIRNVITNDARLDREYVHKKAMLDTQIASIERTIATDKARLDIHIQKRKELDNDYSQRRR